MILECCGCERIYFRRDYWFSEWETLGSHPITGEPRLEGGVETVYWPAPVSRQRPHWLEKIEEVDSLLCSIKSSLMRDFRVRSSLPVARPAADLGQPCAPPVGLSRATRSPGVGSQPCGAKYPRFCADSKGV